MKPKVQNRLQLGFYSRFEDQLNPGHPLYRLANKIDWASFDRDFCRCIVPIMADLQSRSGEWLDC